MATRYVCAACRYVGHRSTCPTCGSIELVAVGPRWRPPRKTSARAWKRIARGELLSDRRAVEAGRKTWRRATASRAGRLRHDGSPFDVSVLRSMRATLGFGRGRIEAVGGTLVISLTPSLSAESLTTLARGLASVSPHPYNLRLRGNDVARIRFVTIASQHVVMETLTYDERCYMVRGQMPSGRLRET